MFQIEGEVEKDSLAKATYQDLHAKRPICAKLLDHNNQIIDTSLAEEEDTEYQSTINKLQVILEVVLIIWSLTFKLRKHSNKLINYPSW